MSYLTLGLVARNCLKEGFPLTVFGVPIIDNLGNDPIVLPMRVRIQWYDGDMGVRRHMQQGNLNFVVDRRM